MDKNPDLQKFILKYLIAESENYSKALKYGNIEKLQLKN